MITILYVDAPDWREPWERALALEGLAVFVVDDRAAALQTLRNAPQIGVVLLDADATGIEPESFARAISASCAGPRPELHLLGRGMEAAERCALLRQGVDAIHDRDGDRGLVLAALRAAERRASVRQELFAQERAAAGERVVDDETGLFNQRYLRLRLREEAERAVREGRPMALMILELASVAEAAADVGPQLAGQVLGEIVGRLRRHLRTYDLLCRMGPSRVAILLPDLEPMSAFSLAKRVLGVLRGEPVVVAGPRGEVRREARVALGMSGLRPGHPGADPSAVIALAERAVAQAATDGGPVAQLEPLGPEA